MRNIQSERYIIRARSVYLERRLPPHTHAKRQNKFKKKNATRVQRSQRTSSHVSKVDDFPGGWWNSRKMRWRNASEKRRPRLGFGQSTQRDDRMAGFGGKFESEQRENVIARQFDVEFFYRIFFDIVIIFLSKKLQWIIKEILKFFFYIF